MLAFRRWLLPLSLQVIWVVQAGFAQVENRANHPLPGGWSPVKYRAIAPAGGVSLADGVFKQMFDDNIGYLLSSFTVNQMLQPFRLRAGHKDAPAEPFPEKFWSAYPGSNAGRFLMGAGNTLRWAQNEELRRRMNAVVDGIASCKQPDGFIMAYPEDKITEVENANYDRSWVTQGLIAAAEAGNPKAFGLIRDFQNWFNQCKYLPLVRNLEMGYQGMIANTRVYFTSVGRPEDIEVAQRYYQEDWWLDQLIARETKAVWNRPKGTPNSHCYELTALEAYLDLYRATGERRYLDAVLSAWDMYHDNWIHTGGIIAISEDAKYPPKSYYLYFDNGTGEFCCSTFWILLNHRLHELFPEEEKYMTEIERSIYNVALANQDGAKGIRYHAVLHGEKEESQCNNTCCEGQGTRLYATLPGYIFSIGKDGLYVNLYASSEIRWKQDAQGVSAKMITNFPYRPSVQLSVDSEFPVQFKLHLRIPSWASTAMQVSVNGTAEGIAQPGSYYSIERTWRRGDTVSFVLPVDFRVTSYTGLTQIWNLDRYGVEYGPILMAFVGPLDFGAGPSTRCIAIRHRPEDVKGWLLPKPDRPLHYSVSGFPQYECMPYGEVGKQKFTCFPIILPDQ